MNNPTPERHQVALDTLVAKLKEDRHVLAAILFGSLVRGEAWEKSDIDLVAVLRDVDVTLPLGVLTCITGVSGSGKSSLIHEILYKKLYSVLHDSRILPGAHRSIEGIEQISDAILIDQSPIGRTPRSNPATYVGVYDRVRRLFANTPEARARGYGVSRFSFNMTEGRCEECGERGCAAHPLAVHGRRGGPLSHLQGGALQRRDPEDRVPGQDHRRGAGSVHRRGG